MSEIEVSGFLSEFPAYFGNDGSFVGIEIAVGGADGAADADHKASFFGIAF